jgi:hypothetical protein
MEWPGTIGANFDTGWELADVVLALTFSEKGCRTTNESISKVATQTKGLCMGRQLSQNGRLTHHSSLIVIVIVIVIIASLLFSIFLCSAKTRKFQLEVSSSKAHLIHSSNFLASSPMTYPTDTKIASLHSPFRHFQFWRWRMADGGWRMADIYIIGSTEHRELLIIDYRNTIHPAHPATTKGSIQFPMIGSPVATFVQRLSRTSIHLRNMSSFPVAASIQDKLRSTFEPTHLEVINDSHMHNV